MPSYEFRCEQCSSEFALFYKSYRDYEAAVPACPQCASTAVTRLIRSVNVQAKDHDYRKMSSDEMLSVLESGDRKQVDQMYRQVTGTDPSQALQHKARVEQHTGSGGSDQPTPPGGKSAG